MTTSDSISDSAGEGARPGRCRPRLDAALEDYSDAWFAAAERAGFPDLLGGVERVRECRQVTEAVSDADLEALIIAAGAVRRELDLVLAHLAAQLAERAARVPKSESVPRRLGFKSPADLIAARIGAPFSDAKRFEVVGEAVNERTSLLGEVLPAKASHVADALDDGAIGLAAAEEIVKFRQRMWARADEATIGRAEQDLVGAAPGLVLRDLRKAIEHVEYYLDQDGREPRLTRQIQQRFLRFRVDADGTVQMRACLDPITAAPIRAAIDHIVTQQLRANRAARPSEAGLGAGSGKGPVFRSVAPAPALAAASDVGTGAVSGDDEAGNGSERGGGGGPRASGSHDRTRGLEFGGVGADGLPGPVSSQDRSVVQLAADALATICKHAIGCTSEDLPSASTTVLVRMPLSDLAAPDIGAACGGVGRHGEAGVGGGMRKDVEAGFDERDIAGGHHIDATRARLLSAAANLIPMVLGTQGEVLDLGRTARHFSKAQRLALTERDGGCAFCGLPASMTEAHHLRWWERDRGRTDLDNGVLLCTTCHHRIHEGWEVRTVPGAGGGTVWFRGPAHSEVGRCWQLGGRKRFDPVFRRKYPPGSPPEDEWSSRAAA